MQKKLFVGGIPYSLQQEELNELFSQFGQVTSATIIRDRVTNQSRGFGFVEMATEDEAGEAMRKLNGMVIGGRRIVVDESKPQEKKSFRESTASQRAR